MGELTHAEHWERHQYLHRRLDELIADFITHTKRLPSKTTVMELMEWSHQQTIQTTELQQPSEGKGGGE